MKTKNDHVKITSSSDYRSLHSLDGGECGDVREQDILLKSFRSPHPSENATITTDNSFIKCQKKYYIICASENSKISN